MMMKGLSAGGRRISKEDFFSADKCRIAKERVQKGTGRVSKTGCMRYGVGELEGALLLPRRSR